MLTSLTRAGARDLVCGALTLALALAYYAGAATIPQSMLADAVGPDGLPKSYAVVLGALSLMLIARALLVRQAEPASTPVLTPAQAEAREAATADVLRAAGPPGEPKRQGTPAYQARRAAGLFAVGVVYLLALPWLGYALCIAALIATTALYQGLRPSLRLGVVAVLGAAFFYLMFVRVLAIPEPAGFWPSLHL